MKLLIIFFMQQANRNLLIKGELFCPEDLSNKGLRFIGGLYDNQSVFKT